MNAAEDKRLRQEGPIGQDRPEGFVRVSQALAQRGHPHAPLWLDVPARTSQEAASALGVAVGQIAKSVIFRRRADEVAVLVRQKLGKTAQQMPLACILEGGTWAAGREIAKELRGDGAPPLKIDSDGTVF